MRLSYHSLCVAFEGARKEQLAVDLMDRHGWSKPKTHQAITQYLMFLYISARHRSVHLVPTCEIDCVWEAAILQNTQQYVQTCQQFCGEIIHHANQEQIQQLPTFPGTEVAFNQTQRLFQTYFGVDASANGDICDTNKNKQSAIAAACGVI